ncbi:MAG: type I restriction enzyme HsdR N-terminal domain-containing protein [Bacteroidetes bacterium]|nr:type I restriction enzyme HsdR N-terminal domain-containing protein [Bacteroidota bacterium]
MEFKDVVRTLGDRVHKLKDSILTEEATKNAFIMPFLQSLGYDVFNPLEVVPEYITDIGTKKGEKIDYAIFKDGQPIILVECKHWSKNLDLHDGQLLRYFHVSKAKFGILTNGIQYRFYTDLEQVNKMDEKPFFEFTIDTIKDIQIEKLKEFHKAHFNLDGILNSANEMKYMNQLRTVIAGELSNPSDELVQYFTKQIYNGRLTSKLMEQFRPLVQRTAQQIITDSVSDRLKAALNREQEQEQKENTPIVSSESKGKVDTTVEEMEAFYIIKAIMRAVVDSSRITWRDAQSYFAVFFDDNNRKPICRVYLDGNRKFIGTFDKEKKEIRSELTSLDDLYKFTAQLQATVNYY